MTALCIRGLSPAPFRASHAISLSETASEPYDRVDLVPEVLRRRMLSLRGFDGTGMMVAADLVDGRALEPAAARLLATADIAFVHVHFAAPGCYACRIERA